MNIVILDEFFFGDRSPKACKKIHFVSQDVQQNEYCYFSYLSVITFIYMHTCICFFAGAQTDGRRKPKKVMVVVRRKTEPCTKKVKGDATRPVPLDTIEEAHYSSSESDTCAEEGSDDEWAEADLSSRSNPRQSSSFQRPSNTR